MRVPKLTTLVRLPSSLSIRSFGQKAADHPTRSAGARVAERPAIPGQARRRQRCDAATKALPRERVAGVEVHDTVGWTPLPIMTSSSETRPGLVQVSAATTTEPMRSATGFGVGARTGRSPPLVDPRGGPITGRVVPCRWPASVKAVTMLSARRAVMPSVVAMSRRRTPGSWAMHSRARAWAVRKLHSPHDRQVESNIYRNILLVSRNRGIVGFEPRGLTVADCRLLEGQRRDLVMVMRFSRSPFL
jgi:hypothetical protein